MPTANLMQRLDDGSTQTIDLAGRLKGRLVAIIGMPGAFTGTCTGKHLPGLIATLPDIKAQGVDEVIVFAVNDPQVMKAWGEVSGATAAGVTLLADPMSELTEALGLRFDAPAGGLIGRCVRFSALIRDGVVEVLNFEEKPLACDLTGGAALLDALRR